MDTSIVFESIPGSKNDQYPDKTVAQGIVHGVICKKGNIITQAGGRELVNHFRLGNGVLYETVEEGAVNKYFEGRK